MLQNFEAAKERWGGVHTLIDQWLHERQEVLVLFCKLAAQDSFDETNGTQSSQLRRLCELLVDYSSAGHFEVYNQLIKEGETFNDNAGLTEAAGLMHRIDPTTDAILDFNDKYQETDDLSSLATDLSQLGMTLETRFAVEDRLIQILHTAHTEDVAG